MPVTSGATIGPYKVDREIGRGGMGVIFLAHDTRLGRTVALKALPEDVAADPDRLQRFEREARVLASLNHPNVAAIYGLEESEGRRYLALEHIEGETLADRIARGPLPLQETLNVCIEIACGVEAAHDGGVVHRDLKPANVMITPNEQVKVLDFGLAKGRVATDEEGLAKSPALVDSPTLSSPTLPHSPTFINPATMVGVILGTAAYLSPEQARGKVVDRRTDIWSFGCIVYECLTGKRAFEGETVSDTIAKILEREMDWSTLPKHTPARLRELLERCLTKDPKKRLRDIGDARLTLEEIKSGRYAGAGASADAAAPASAAAKRRTAILLAAAAIAGAALGAAGWNAFTAGRTHTEGVMHLALPTPPDVQVQGAASDGRTIALIGKPLTAGARDLSLARLYMRRMDQPEFDVVRGTEGASALFMSANGRTIEYWAPAGEQTRDLRRFRMPADRSAPPVPVGNVDPEWDVTGAWLESGDLMLSTNNGLRYVRLPAKGGSPSPPTRFVVPGYPAGRFFPEGKPLPGDRGVFLSAIWYEGEVYRQGIGILDPRSGKTKILIRDAGSPAYHAGVLCFSRQDALFAVRFDLGKMEVKGEPVGIMNDLRQENTSINARFGITPNGMLVYAGGGNVVRNRHVIVVDRQGNVSEWSPERRPYEYDLKASPDGSRATLSINNANAITETWVSERGQPAARRVRSRPGADCLGNSWSQDGRWLAFAQNANDSLDGIYLVDAAGASAPRRIARKPSPTSYFIPTSMSPDGRTMLTTNADSNRVAIWVFQVPAREGEPGIPRQITGNDALHALGIFSPDGRVVAYQSNETGRGEVYASEWAGDGFAGLPIMVSRGGGDMPRWGKDGKHLYYSVQGKLMSVGITSRPGLTATSPTLVWDLAALRIPPNRLGAALYDILPDGRLIAVQKGPEEQNPTQANVILNFDEVLKERMRAARK
ncbi:MAG: serine/threonine-protein kinase [Candidatus Eisenbacteria bacterium]|uniref:Serine/threonine-protein kinase n=1 Tax=Eiseniibacteriota bacterium TaxID=2212470 RepID=A0A538SZP4_UNCEI|nr:MAG: serine/threonine-protein kinase [Candidatus Eisenbacteria bacterium]